MEWTEYHENLLKAALLKYGRMVYWLRRRGEDYEDIEQEMRVRVWENLQTYDPTKSQVSTYIFRVVHNKLANWITILNYKKRNPKEGVISIEEIEQPLDNLVDQEHLRLHRMRTDPERRIVENELLNGLRRELLLKFPEWEVDIFINHLLYEEPIGKIPWQHRPRMKEITRNFLRQYLSLNR